MTRYDRIAIALMVALLTACGGEPPLEPANEEPPSLEGNVFEDQVRALDRARGVEQQLQESADARLKALEAQEEDGG